MKKIIISGLVLTLPLAKTQACSWYDPDYEYFNLFSQDIIKNKSLTPFLLTYSSRYYPVSKNLTDENIENWRTYFGNALSYQETEYLIKKLPLNDLQNFKKGLPVHNTLLNKLGSRFYANFQEGFDYIIQAKYMEPYASIKSETQTTEYFGDTQVPYKDFGDLDYKKTVTALISLYNAAKNKDIKLRYAYQLIRFQHYNLEYLDAVNSFKKYVDPIKHNSTPYYLALQQYAGALRGLQRTDDANWNFFQVFKNSKNLKQSSYSSIKLSDSASFANLIKRAENTNDRSTAYFLLGYQDFNNPLPMMEKIYKEDPSSEMLKVLAARAINEIERNYLPVYFHTHTDEDTNTSSHTEINTIEETKKDQRSFWQKIGDFFRSLFNSEKDEEKTPERSNNLSDKKYLNHPQRIPFLEEKDPYEYERENAASKEHLKELSNFTNKASDASQDEYWKIANAYLKFLEKDYKISTEILDNIKTNNPEYLEQITKMKMLNDITSQPKITPEFEEHLYTTYKKFFEATKEQKNTPNEGEESVEEDYDYYYGTPPSTKEFLVDIIANRYFIQGEDAKSFLMSNRLSDLRNNPSIALTKSLEDFYNKKNKTSFEEHILLEKMQDVGSPSAFFHLIYGDFNLRAGKFTEAIKHYQQAELFTGFDIPKETYNYETGQYEKISNLSELYDGYRNISSLIFGHNQWECYHCDASETMIAETFVSDFPFIQSKMNKLELADALVELDKIGKGKGIAAARANQLIGNFLYNTSKLGYFREVLSLDIDNSNGGKFHFDQPTYTPKVYYKQFNFSQTWTNDNYDIATNYYKKAFKQTTDREQQARILFQLASLEQGQYYLYEVSQPAIDWRDEDWIKKTELRDTKNAKAKNEKFRTYFAQLKSNYQDTETSKKLQGSCTYYSHFLTK